MTRRLSVFVCLPLMVWFFTMTGCDPTASKPDPMRNFWGDPPVIYTILNSITGKQTAVRIEFPSYGKTVSVSNPPGFSFLPHGMPGFEILRRPLATRHGSGVDLPDPDEHTFDPWDWPDPEDDFPLPDPPEFPDPFDDPFDEIPLPEPPPFPDDEMDMSDFSPGTTTILDTGGEQLGYVQPPPSTSAKSPRAITVVTSIPVGPNPSGIVTSPDQKTLYVAVGGNGTIAVIDRKARTITRRITLPAGAQPYALAITPDGTRLYTGEFAVVGSAAIYSIDLPSGNIKALPTAGSVITQAIVSPDGTQVWICNYFGNVYVFDVLTNTLIASLPITGAWNVAFNANGTRAYVTNGIRGTPGAVTVIDPSTFKTITSITVGNTPRNIRVTPSGRHIFVTNYDSNFITQIDAYTNQVIRSIPIGDTGASGIKFAHR